MKSKIIIIIIVIVAVGLGITGYVLLQPEEDTAEMDPKPEEQALDENEQDTPATESEPEIDDPVVEDPPEMMYQYQGDLADVTNGNTTTGINTGGSASGIAKANFENNTYNLLATFKNLPDPQGTDFYEGWVVRTGSGSSVKSSGRVEKKDGVYQNVFTANEDLTDHAFYVLTIEPDDGDPAPAKHILEGTMTPIN